MMESAKYRMQNEIADLLILLQEKEKDVLGLQGELQAQRRDFVKQIEFLLQQKTQQEERADDLAHRLEMATLDRQSLIQNIDEKKQKNFKLVRQARDLSDSLSEAVRGRDDALCERDHLLSTNAIIEHSNRLLAEENQQMKLKLEEASSLVNAELEVEIEKLRERVVRLSRERDEVTERCEKAQQERDRVLQNSLEADSRVFAAQAKATRIAAENEELCMHMARVGEHRESLLKDLERLERDKESIEREMSLLSSKLSEKDTILESLKVTIGSLQQDLERLMSERAELADRCGDLSGKLQISENDLAGLRIKNRELEAECETLSSDRVRLTKALSESDEAKRNAELERDEAQGEARRLNLVAGTHDRTASERDRLVDENSALAEEMRKAKLDAATAGDRVEALLTNVADLESRLREEHHSTHASQSECTSLRARCETMESENARLQTEIATLSQRLENGGSERVIRQLEAECDALKRERDVLNRFVGERDREETARLQSDIVATLKAKEEVSVQLAVKTQELQALSDRFAEQAAEVARLRGEDDVRVRLAVAERQLPALRDELERAKSKKEDARKKFSEVSASLESTQQELAAKTKEMEDLKIQRAQFLNESHAAKQIAAKAEQDLRTASEKNRELTRQLGRLGVDVGGGGDSEAPSLMGAPLRFSEVVESRLKSLVQERDDLRRELAQQKELFDRCAKEWKEISVSVAREEPQVDQAQKLIEGLVKERDELRAALDRVVGLSRMHAEQIGELTDELQRMRGVEDESTAALNQARDELAQVAAERDELLSKLELLQTELTQQTKELTTAIEKHKADAREIEVLSDENIRQARRVRDMESRVAEMTDKIAHANEKLSAQSAEVERHLATVAALEQDNTALQSKYDSVCAEASALRDEASGMEALIEQLKSAQSQSTTPVASPRTPASAQPPNLILSRLQQSLTHQMLGMPPTSPKGLTGVPIGSGLSLFAAAASRQNPTTSPPPSNTDLEERHMKLLQQLKDSNAELENLRADIVEKDNTITHLQEKICELESENSELERALQEAKSSAKSGGFSGEDNMILVRELECKISNLSEERDERAKEAQQLRVQKEVLQRMQESFMKEVNTLKSKLKKETEKAANEREGLFEKVDAAFRENQELKRENESLAKQVDQLLLKSMELDGSKVPKKRPSPKMESVSNSPTNFFREDPL